ncbi:MAG: tRNA pseudouridine(38-40) synthase TruA [Cyanobacteria bacterium SW_7_48_12]|nr:MAG: tRNA pseudouridine(38-40) synthase TruA [Cyanobacteria bacterium SW_7_48_12]
MSPVCEPTSQRVALLIQYVGSEFHGWQRQPHHRTVQEEIEEAIAHFRGKPPVTLHGAGRTDAGVHAAAQVAHFDVAGPIPAQKWAAILNDRLPSDVLIRASAPVPPTWHARFSALWRRYRYTLYTDPQPSLFIKPFSWHYYWVEIHAAECYEQQPLVQLEIQASGFLYGMVRLLVGMLVEVGRGMRSPENFTELWVNQQRDQVKYAAPAKGLCLLSIGYPESPFPPDVQFDPILH